MTVGTGGPRTLHPHRLSLLGALLLLTGCAEDAVLEFFPCSTECETGTSQGQSTSKGQSTSSDSLDAGMATSSGGAATTDADVVTSSGGAATTDAGSSLSTSTTDNTSASDSTSASGGATSCDSLAERVRTTELVLPAAATPSTEYYPVTVAPRSDSTSLLAYRQSGELNLAVLELDDSDEVLDTVFEVAGQEAHALMAHEDGGVLVYVREDPDIFSSEVCSQAARCNSLELARFDNDGAITMTSTLTDKLPVAQEGALFMWWFQHTARIAFANDSYGVYFRSAQTLSFPEGLTPRPGDTLRFVDTGGNRLEQGWGFGCVPSWSVRIVHNQVWAAVCHGESPNAHRLVILDGAEQRELRLLEGVPAAYRALGGLSAHGNDFFLSYLLRNGSSFELRLALINTEPAVVDEYLIDEATDLLWEEGYTFRTFHAPLGGDLLLGWFQGTKQDSQLLLARVDPDTGELLEGPISTDAPIDHFVEFTPYPNGDIAWAYADSEGAISVTRVLGCPP